MFVSDLRQAGVPRFPPPIKLTPTIQLKFVESGVKHPKQTNQPIIDKYSLFVKKPSDHY
jgi:hypothetical protein